MKNPKEIASEHWEWVQDLINTLNEGGSVPIDTAEFLYRSAFEHGFKHASEQANSVDAWCGAATCPNNKGNFGTDKLCSCEPTRTTD